MVQFVSTLKPIPLKIYTLLTEKYICHEYLRGSEHKTMITLTRCSISFKNDKLIVLFMTFHTLMSSKHNTQELYITNKERQTFNYPM